MWLSLRDLKPGTRTQLNQWVRKVAKIGMAKPIVQLKMDDCWESLSE